MEEQRDGEVRDDQNNLHSGGDGVTDEDAGATDDDVDELDQRDDVEYEQDQKVGDGGVTINRLLAEKDVKKQESNELKDFDDYLHRFIEFIRSFISGLSFLLLCCLICFLLCCITCYYICRFTWFVYFHRNEPREFGNQIQRWAQEFIPQVISMWNEEDRDTNDSGDRVHRLRPNIVLQAYTGDEGDREFGRDTNRNDFFTVTPLVATTEESNAGENGNNNGGDRLPQTPLLKKLLLKLSKSFT
ncbi:hypothetical protein HanRHA438_Chr00c06g0845791 [Helianthus annuus]|nr:hypothetical protein HanRHA438_Chr00c06g0845791 [Helianthus annuus]